MEAELRVCKEYNGELKHQLEQGPVPHQVIQSGEMIKNLYRSLLRAKHIILALLENYEFPEEEGMLGKRQRTE